MVSFNDFLSLHQPSYYGNYFMIRDLTLYPEKEFWNELYFDYGMSKFVREALLLGNTFDDFQSDTVYDGSRTRLLDLTTAVNRFLRLYAKDLPELCSYIKMHYLYMDPGSFRSLINANETEVRGVLKREEKERKKAEIESVRQNFEV